jgi:hypothetical protein
MAKIINIPISGKVGLNVDMPGRYGQVRRNWVIPSNPETAAQLAVRSRLATCISGFKSLTQAQQDTWNSAARAQSTRSRLGTNGPMTGLQLYTKLNSTLLMLGQEAITAPPGVTVLGDPAPQGLVITNTGGTIALKLTCPTSPGENTVLRGAAPVSSAVRRTPQVQVLGTCPAPAQGSATITSLYTAKHGTPVEGDQIFITAEVMVNGYLGVRRVMSAVVPASS